MERMTLTTQREHLQSKYVGTGNADISKHEWLTGQYRDTCASIMGHSNLLYYNATAENQSLERTRMELLERMIQPCGPPPPPKK